MKNTILLTISLIISIILIIWSVFIEPNMIEVKHFTVKDPQLQGIKIVFAGDFHFKKYQTRKAREIINIINSQNADLVLSTGDFINGHKESSSMPINDIANVLGQIKPKMFTVLGNHDFWGGSTKLTLELENKGIKVLSNSSEKIEIRNKTIYIAGVEDLQTGNPDINKALENTNKPVILLTHSPDIFPEISQDINLTLAGHVHGGQIRLPFIGAVIIPSTYGNRYSQGLIVENNKTMIVTKGIGTSILPVRFNCKPEIVVIDFI